MYVLKLAGIIIKTWVSKYGIVLFVVIMAPLNAIGLTPRRGREDTLDYIY